MYIYVIYFIYVYNIIVCFISQFSSIVVLMLDLFFGWAFYMLLVWWVLGTDAKVKSEVGRPQTGLNPQWALLLAGRSKAY